MRLRQDGELARRQEPELLAEVGLHLLDPLRHQTLGGDDQHPLHQPPQLEFPEDQPGFDGLAQADFIGQQVTNPVAGDGTSQCVQADAAAGSRPASSGASSTSWVKASAIRAAATA